MKIEKEERILMIYLESKDSLLRLKEEILESAKQEEVYAIAFIVTKEWKFNLKEAEPIFHWMKKIPFLTMIAVEEISDSNKVFSVFGEYRLTKVSYEIEFSSYEESDWKNRGKLLYGARAGKDTSYFIQANVPEENICDAIRRKGKEWFSGKSADHIRLLIAFFKNFNEEQSEEKLLSLESHAFCDLIRGEQVNMP
ncbi:hypothetical protein [[Clostridium] polysaccharolyticum]|uniref:Uncharacterized protein n=1 Tax=[Clostridium] polysaccharolyticum TaxID=29364 RepID=A0A1I0EE97_9FIRM|nr:hypothetical protein [[Clostridium] polysaccharolyticum]SET43389.1 hypothetical protein SAMN04487772_12032 [[Clostridium] polysaccharolyticum]